MNTDLKTGEPHPAGRMAQEWIASQSEAFLMEWRLAFSAAALNFPENTTARVCLGTLERLLSGQPVSDRYVLGLAWILRHSGLPCPHEHRHSPPSDDDKANVEWCSDCGAVRWLLMDGWCEWKTPTC